MNRFLDSEYLLDLWPAVSFEFAAFTVCNTLPAISFNRVVDLFAKRNGEINATNDIVLSLLELFDETNN
jgi:hypothetical protein